ncbi:MAG TPA: hypothetical protein VE988_06345 [Gemmataceae bacterium]|nr:hypothetical protein [Gemmataceae bacterium]
MPRFAIFLLLIASMSLLSLTSEASMQDPKQPEGSVIAIHRGGGFVIPDQNPYAYYWFTLAKDGAWELKPLKGDSKKGKIAADDVGNWVKEIKDGGFDKLKSNPALGAADEPFMDITIQADNKKDQKRIPLEQKLAKALEKKIFELAKPGK